MAYTQAWSNLIPLGSAAASTADDEIRNLRRDTQERMDTILGAGKWATDPVAAPLTGVKIFSHYSDGKLQDATALGAPSYQTKYVTGTATGNGSTKYVLPIKLQVGSIITSVSGYVSIGGVAGVSIGLTALRIDPILDTSTSFGLVLASTVVGPQALTTAVASEVVLDARIYVITLDIGYTALGGTFYVYGMAVTYTKSAVLS